jgi:hypothetical protein
MLLKNALVCSIAVLLLFATVAPAQKSSGPTYGPTAGPNAGSTPGGDQFRPLSLSGRVVLEDGTPPPEPAMIEMRCEGQRQPQYYTNKKGNFNFRVGGELSQSLADSQRQTPGQPVGASGSDRSHVSLTNCELEASLPGYTSSKIFLGRRSVFEDTDVGTIVLHRLAKGEGSFVSANSMAAPSNAKKAYEKGEKEITKQPPDNEKASKELQKAVELYPQYAAAWNLLGKARLGMKDTAAAHEAYLKAAEADPKFVPPMLSLALMEMQQQRMAESAKWAGQVLKLLPDLAEANYYNAVANLSLGNAAAAETSIRAVLASPDAQRYPRSHFILGNLLAQKGEAEKAAAEFRAFLEVEPTSRAAEAVKQQLAEWKASGLIK